MKKYKIKVTTNKGLNYHIVSAEDELDAIDIVIQHYKINSSEEIIDIEVI